MLFGKVALVTGGSRGIGRGICLDLAKHGAKVVVNFAGSQTAAEETVALIKEKGGEAFALQGDVASVSDSEKMIEAVIAAYGRLDILVNNAGITRDNLMMRMKEEDWDAVINTNLKGTFNMTKAVTRTMMKQRSGRIINITSVAGLAGSAGQVNYVSSKAGIIGLTKAAAKELASRGITVNAVAPGYVETEMTDILSDEVKARFAEAIPMGRMGKPEDIARAVSFLASENAEYITGQILTVDGGMVM